MDPKIEQVLKKSAWASRGKPYRYICPLCQSERSLSLNPNPVTPMRVLQIGICTAFFMLCTWSIFEWKGVVAFVPFWMIFEFFYRAKVRSQASCTECGFDPFLYLVDIKKARAEIETHWKKKFAEKGIEYPTKGRPAASNNAQPVVKIEESMEDDLEPPTKTSN